MSNVNYYGRRYRDTSWATGRDRAKRRHPSTLRVVRPAGPCLSHDYPDRFECPTCTERGEERWEGREDY